jgi:hypothetical protein
LGAGRRAAGEVADGGAPLVVLWPLDVVLITHDMRWILYALRP